jgi:V/A-type H+/Na+-transporting ATPase subunit F
VSGKVAIIGDAASVAGFRPLGFRTLVAEPPARALELWPEVAGGEYGVVLVTEPVYEVIGDLIAEARERPIPAVTIIPGAGSAGGVGEARLARAIERALGTTLPTESED